MLHAFLERLRKSFQRNRPRPRLGVEILESRTLLHGGHDHGSFDPGVFTDLALPLTGVAAASLSWGDYDNDGNLDFAVIGTTGTQRLSRIFHNDGNGSFTDIHAALDNVSNGSASWADYDNDGRLDLLLTGVKDTTGVTKLYHNEGGGVFRDVNAQLIGVANGSAAWGDYDQDGKVDLILTGATSAVEAVTHLYRNLGQGFFVRQAILPGLSSSAAAWGDLNGDGRLDFIVSGTSPGLGHVTRIYQNNGDGTFTDIHANLPAGFNAIVDLGDYDNDGRLDILLSGRFSVEDGFTRVLRNQGGGVFVDAGAGLEPLALGALRWGDFDNDGRLDILMAGTTHDASAARIYHNHDAGFEAHQIAGDTEQGVRFAGAAWGDFNNDGKLDIALAGSTDAGAVLRVYRNDSATANTAPSAPGGLRATAVSSSAVKLIWNPAVDGQTPSAGLTYNVYVGTAPGTGDIAGPMANTATGQRRIARLGAIQGTSWIISGLQPGNTYYWSVQTIDAGLAGSAFASATSFTAGGVGAAQLKIVGKPGMVHRLVRPIVVQLTDAAGEPLAQAGIVVQITVNAAGMTRTFNVRTDAAGQAKTPTWSTWFRPTLVRLVRARATALVDGVQLSVGY